MPTSFADMSFEDGLDQVALRFAKTAAGPDPGGLLGQVQSQIGKIPGQLRGMWSGLSPDQQQAALHSLYGAGIGGTLGAASSLMQPRDRRSPVSRGLTGMLAGGMAGGLGSLALSGMSDVSKTLDSPGAKLQKVLADLAAGNPVADAKAPAAASSGTGTGSGTAGAGGNGNALLPANTRISRPRPFGGFIDGGERQLVATPDGVTKPNYVVNTDGKLELETPGALTSIPTYSKPTPYSITAEQINPARAARDPEFLKTLVAGPSHDMSEGNLAARAAMPITGIGVGFGVDKGIQALQARQQMPNSRALEILQGKETGIKGVPGPPLLDTYSKAINAARGVPGQTDKQIINTFNQYGTTDATVPEPDPAAMFKYQTIKANEPKTLPVAVALDPKLQQVEDYLEQTQGPTTVPNKIRHAIANTSKTQNIPPGQLKSTIKEMRKQNYDPNKGKNLRRTAAGLVGALTALGGTMGLNSRQQEMDAANAAFMREYNQGLPR